VLWQRFGWIGVCGLGSVLLVGGCLIYASGEHHALSGRLEATRESRVSATAGGSET